MKKKVEKVEKVEKQDNLASAFELLKAKYNISRTLREKIDYARALRVLSSINIVVESEKLSIDNIEKFSAENAEKLLVKEKRVFSFLVAKTSSISLSTNNEEMSEVCNIRNRAFIADAFKLNDADIEKLEIARKSYYKSQI